jgi:hypothetical protein
MRSVWFSEKLAMFPLNINRVFFITQILCFEDDINRISKHYLHELRPLNITQTKHLLKMRCSNSDNVNFYIADP